MAVVRVIVPGGPVLVGVGTVMVMPVVVVVVTMMMVVCVVVVAAMRVVVGLDRALRSERPRRGLGDAAEAAHELGVDRRVRNVQAVPRDLRRDVVRAELPGEPQEARRVLGAHRKQRLLGGADLDEPSVLEPQGVAVLEFGRLRQCRREGERRTLERRLAGKATRGVRQGDRVGDALGPHRCPADDRLRVQHPVLREHPYPLRVIADVGQKGRPPPPRAWPARDFARASIAPRAGRPAGLRAPMGAHRHMGAHRGHARTEGDWFRARIVRARRAGTSAPRAGPHRETPHVSAYDHTPPGGQSVDTVDQLSSVTLLGLALVAGLVVMGLALVIG